ncbi:ATP-binding protein [endosymbiont of unidentified scaly snail isolate Monju]|uniref:ATP-binding protein n=1 Tax=endosymbiont of unidentified scaly snail isolate Monju TaxID=1248727 RepID=UPI0003892165|nr:ATP-binding protein [endosymbiont of unidentified scaly snail isolate Monju]BAN69640.1 two-component system, NarL family, hybrid sensor histidine kinase and response regulator [endosymbiont of unidentified scaly snail isolate Monju]
MKRLSLYSLRVKALLLGVVPAMLMSLLIGAYLIGVRFASLEEALESRGKALANELAAMSLYGLFSGDRHTLESSVRSFLSRPDIVKIRVRDNHGKLLLELEKPKLSQRIREKSSVRLHNFRSLVRGISLPSPSDLPGDAETPDNPSPPALGMVELTLIDESLVSLQHEALITTLVIITAGILLTSLIALFMSERVVHPIIALSEAVERIRRGDLSARVEQGSRGEIGLLEAGFNQMAQRIAMTQDELQAEVEQAVKDLQTTMDALEVRNIELDLARKRALEASKAKSDFLAIISHEIRTPMNGITGFARLLARSNLSPEQHEQLKAIQESADNLLAIINEVLDFSKLESGQLQFHDEPYRVRSLVSSVITLFTPQAEEKGLQLRHLVYDDVPTWLVGDSLRIRQVLINLVGNAIKFTDSGKVTVRVMLDGDDDEELITFSVQDTGIGLDPLLGDRLFEPFTQGESDTTRRYGGTGLGLSISKKLVKGMQGGIGFDSEPGKGSTFWFSLPLRTPEELFEDSSMAAVDDDSFLSHTPLANMRILVADDNPINLELTRTVLQRHEATVSTATTGQEALQLAERQSFDLILMDIHMPVMSGLEAAKAIRNGSGPNTATPIVAITADVTAANQKRIFAVGMSEIIIKPLDETRLMSVINNLFQLRDRLDEQADEKSHATEGEPAQDEDLPIRDRDCALRVAGGDQQVAGRMFRMLVDNLEKDLPQLQRLAQSGDMHQLWEQAHKLKGAAAACGTPALHRLLDRLGSAARANDIGKISVLIERLAEQLSLLRQQD